jgi:hypothetical protein
LAKFTLQPPFADGFAHDFAGCRIFVRLDGGLEGGELPSRQGDADFLDVGLDASPIVSRRIFAA